MLQYSFTSACKREQITGLSVTNAAILISGVIGSTKKIKKAEEKEYSGNKKQLCKQTRVFFPLFSTT